MLANVNLNKTRKNKELINRLTKMDWIETIKIISKYLNLHTVHVFMSRARQFFLECIPI